MPLLHTGPHLYHRIIIKRTGRSLHKCELPGCPHHIRTELVWNRRSLCWKCRTPFIMTRAYRRTARPKCPACLGRPVPQETELIEVDDLLGEKNPIKDLLDRMAREGLE